MSAPTQAQIREYGVAAGRACAALGIRSEEDRRGYRRLAVRELTGRESVKDIRSSEDYDAVMARLWDDAGNYERAIHYRINSERRLSYVIQVLASQLMQLKGGSEADAQAYIGGVLDQARIPNGRNLDRGDYWLDVAPTRLRELVQILDTERRRILRRHGVRQLSFSDLVRYDRDFPIITIRGVPAGYYSEARITVNLRSIQ